MDFRVSVARAFLRSEPKKKVGNELAVLPENSKLTEVSGSTDKWLHVQTILSGVKFTGFIARTVTSAADTLDLPVVTGTKVPAVHYKENNAGVTRKGKAGASPLGEAAMPRRRSADGLDSQPLRDFIDWAAVDDPSHLRWKPASGLTFCNIYAYDYCYAAGVFIPRVWWKPEAIKKLEAGQAVSVAYDQTVREMNANALHDWLLDWGDDFGWERATTVTQLQQRANEGAVAIICAARVNPSKSGHITAVISEDAANKAHRVDGAVILPLQSQAGSNNVRRGTIGKAWWRGEQFRSFVFFYNKRPSIW